MYVAKLSATDFRSYAQVDLDFDPGVTALVGPNGQGKTNLIEAIGYLATLGSHRVSLDAPMVREGAERAAEIESRHRAALSPLVRESQSRCNLMVAIGELKTLTPTLLGHRSDLRFSSRSPCHTSRAPHP